MCNKSTHSYLHRRQLSILKSQEEFANRLRTTNWQSPTADVMFRLAALAAVADGRSERQIFNLAKINS